MPKAAPIEVVLMDGEYNMSSGISFTSADSGTAEAPITYKAAEGARVVLNGATKLDISKIDKVVDSSVLAKVSEDAAKNLVEIDLTEQGIPERIAKYASNWKGALVGRPMGVYLNDDKQTLSRWPNAGYEKINSVSEEKTINISNANDRLAKWVNHSGLMFVEGYISEDWNQEWSRVDAINSTGGTLTLNTTGYSGLKNGNRIAVVNMLEEIDLPGEWYVDEATMKMYYYPPKTLTADDKLEIASLCDNFISFEDVQYVNLEGISFKYNANIPGDGDDFYYLTDSKTSAGIRIENGNNIDIKNCSLDEIGMDGIYINNSEKILIDNSFITNSGYSGIGIENCGDKESLTSCDITVSNCYIAAASQQSGLNGRGGVRIWESIGVTVAKNIFRDMKNTALWYSGNHHTIEKNEFYNCVHSATDGGAVYAGRSWSQYGTKIKNNYFHDIGGLTSNYETCAVFWDDSHSGNTFSGNIVAMNNDNTAAVKVGGGRDNLVENNVLVNATYGVLGEDRIVNPTSSDFQTGSLFTSFLWAAKEGVASATDLGNSDNWLDSFEASYPEMMKNFNDVYTDKTYKRANTFKNNLYYDAGTQIGIFMSADSTFTNENKYASKTTSGATTKQATEVFVDPVNGDYRVKSAYSDSGSRPNENTTLADTGMAGSIVLPEALKNFDLVYPANYGTADCKSVTLKWNKSGFADKYKYEVSDNADFTNIVSTGETKDNFVSLSLPNENKVYYWRVTAINISKQIGESVLCNSVYAFTAIAGGIVNTVANYDNAAKKVSYEIINNSAENATACVIIAVKNQLKVLENVLIDKDISINAGSKHSNLKDVSADVGDNVIMYVFDSLVNIKPLTTLKPWIQK